MAREIKRDPKTPKEVNVTGEARAPVSDPTLGVPVAAVAAAPARSPRHRLVTIGDSLTHGFQSGAVHRTEISFPRIIAWEMGWDESFRYPRYAGFGGLPLNIEYVVRRLEDSFGDRIAWWEAGFAAFRLRSLMDEVEDYWERGAGSSVPALSGIHHNLGIYGWDLRDVLSCTAKKCRERLASTKDDLIVQLVENANDRAALRVLPATADGGVLDAAKALGQDGGIETLIVLLGANNALRSVVELNVKWSAAGYKDLDEKRAYTVWNPLHFKDELLELRDRIREIDARHVIWGTVPHVTIAPITRGVGAKVAPDSRYFPYYTRPWIKDDVFDPRDDPCITEGEARAVDSAIDQYNEDIAGMVHAQRNEGRDWYVLDVAGLLDRLAHRRYIESPAARPAWWTPYPLPDALAKLNPVPSSRFYGSGREGRTSGGLFSLDGVHPTTICYGILAQEFIKVMQVAGVKFYLGDRVTERKGPVLVDFERLLKLDDLLRSPPCSFTNDLELLGWLDDKTDVLRRMLRTVL